MTTPMPSSESPQARLVSMLDTLRPSSLLAVTTHPVDVLCHWCEHHGCTLTAVQDPDPLHLLNSMGRFDLALVADQLEYMNHNAGEELLGRLRNLHAERLVVLYQPDLSPASLRWQNNDFLAMGLRRDSHFVGEDRQMLLYTYELATYNFARSWNNPDYWANPALWGKYWW